ncbi:MAG: N-acetylmuramic acid 6-phosphate etherase [Planctomycetota bacterium]|jgi:N-acetylmuramic acid 6-phosphate etherase
MAPNKDTGEELTTESINQRSAHLDELSPLELVRLMNREDHEVVTAVEAAAPQIGAAIEAVASALRAGGRLFYLGAGTSGRLGVLDAAECPPTFSTEPELVQGLIAGGQEAVTRAIEGAEDDTASGCTDLQSVDLCHQDAVVGITASGRTPYVLGGMRYATELAATTIGVCCNRGAPLADVCQIPIELLVGPEILAGSTRLKAGTATKMVLNMLSTGAMVGLGKTHGNLMVDVRANSQKLRQRAVRLVRRLAEVDSDTAEELLAACAFEVKTAVVMHRRGVSVAAARERLRSTSGRLRQALDG